MCSDKPGVTYLTPGPIFHFIKLEKVHHNCFIVSVKIPFRTPSLQHHLMLIKLHPGDMPSAIQLFQENRNIHFPITVTTRVHMIQKKRFFFPLILYFISSIFLFYFTSKIAAQISGGTMCVRKAFYLLSVLTICTSHYAPDIAGK